MCAVRANELADFVTNARARYDHRVADRAGLFQWCKCRGSCAPSAAIRACGAIRCERLCRPGALQPRPQFERQHNKTYAENKSISPQPPRQHHGSDHRSDDQ
jgi:hypothetical protein